jgi:hypothetical protein
MTAEKIKEIPTAPKKGGASKTPTGKKETKTVSDSVIARVEKKKVVTSADLAALQKARGQKVLVEKTEKGNGN